MNTKEIITFDQNRMFRSKPLSWLVESLNDFAIIILFLTIAHIIIGYIDSQIADYFSFKTFEDIIRMYIVTWSVRLINIRSTKINLISKTIRIRHIGTRYAPKEWSVLEITKIDIYAHHIYQPNICIYFKKGNQMSTSIKECNKFVKLLQELNPEIEVEYKE